MSDTSKSSRLCRCKTNYCLQSNICDDNIKYDLLDTNYITYNNYFNSAVRPIINDNLKGYKQYLHNRNEYPKDIIEYFNEKNLIVFTIILIVLIILIIFV
jgi:hypothetical protein